MIYKIENVRFDKNKIILNKNNKELQINIKEYLHYVLCQMVMEELF